MSALAAGRVPLILKLAYSAWMVVWVAVYWVEVGPTNFLWLCDVANFLLLAALWAESPLLISSQAVSVLLVQVLWIVDAGTRLAAGFHPIGGTEYMFDPAESLWARSLSLFHVWMPLLMIWLLLRLGYDRRAWRLQTAICWLVLPLSYLAGDAETNLNWLWKPFGVEQSWLPAPPWSLPLMMLLYPLVLYLPSHTALRAWARLARRPRLLP